MFDLFRSRAKAVRIFLGALLVLVALSMVTYLVPGGFGGDRAQDQVVVEIGKEALTFSEVQQRLEMAKRNRSVPPGSAAVFAQQMLDSLISSRALVYEARRMGMTVSDADVANALRAQLPDLFPNGQFAGTQAYAATLEQMGMTIPQFEAEMRDEMLVSRLTGLAVDNAIVTPDEVAREFQRRGQRVKLEYVEIHADKFKDQVTVSPEEIRIYFNSVRAQYRTPEKRSFQMLVADAAKIGQKIVIPDDQLRRMYDQNKDQFRIPERVHVRHILLKTTDKQPAEIPQIQAKAEDLLKQLKAGGNFETLARKYSEDPGSGAKGGDLGWIVREQTVKAFENAAFSLKPNELSGVIKTEYGFHILQVLEKQDAHVKPFEEVKDQIAEERKKQQVYDIAQQLADQAHDELTKHPLQAAAIASHLGLDLLSVNDVVASQPLPVFGTNPDFGDAISALAVGGVTSVMTAPGDKLVVAVVTGVTAARPAEFAEVEGQIRSVLAQLKLKDTVRRAAGDLADKAKAEGGDLRKVAQQMGLEVKTPPDFGPEGAAEGIGPASVLRPAFDQPVGSVFGPILVGGRQFVCRVAERVGADMTRLETQRADIQAALKEKKSQEQMELFVDSIRSALIREGKVKIHQQVYDRVLAANHG